MKMETRIEQLEIRERARLNSEFQALLEGMTRAELRALCSTSHPDVDGMTQQEIIAQDQELSQHGSLTELGDALACLQGWIADHRAATGAVSNGGR